MWDSRIARQPHLAINIRARSWQWHQDNLGHSYGLTQAHLSPQTPTYAHYSAQLCLGTFPMIRMGYGETLFLSRRSKNDTRQQSTRYHCLTQAHFELNDLRQCRRLIS